MRVPPLHSDPALARAHPPLSGRQSCFPNNRVWVAWVSVTRPDRDGGREGPGLEGARVPAKAGVKRGSPVGAGTWWRGRQLDLNFSLCVQCPSDLLL